MKLEMEKIKSLFDKYDHQYKVLIAIYETVLADWSKIESISGSPTVSTQTWQDICAMFIEYDKRNHPDVLAAGIWLNRGFDSCPKMKDNMVDISHLEIEYKEVVC
jgi:hypothetical protein